MTRLRACVTFVGMSPRALKWTICVALFLTAVVLYWPAGAHDFINFDDDIYVFENPNVIGGLTPRSVRWAFASFHATNWHPLTWLSHMLDCELYGLDAGKHHLTSVLIHGASSVVLFLALLALGNAGGGRGNHAATGATQAAATKPRRKSRKGRRETSSRLRSAVPNSVSPASAAFAVWPLFWAAAFVAAVFAVHPTHVESVAWISERKDVLSALFWMLTLWAYAGYARAKMGTAESSPMSGLRFPVSTAYALSLLFFALGILSKPMLVTLPFLLLLLDYWPLGRLRFEAQRVRSDALLLVVEKIPFFALAFGSMIVTFIAQKTGGAVRSLMEVPLGSRLANATTSFAAYALKTLWPSRLSIYYPFREQISMLQVAFALLFVAGGTLFVLWKLRKRPWLAVGWFWYLGTLIPVIGIVQVGNQAMADRYTYIPTIGLSIMLAYSVAEACRSPQRGALSSSGMRWFLGVGAACLLGTCGWLTRSYLRTWYNDISLYEHALKVTKRNWLVHNNYAIAIEEAGRKEEAFWHYQEAVRIAPNYEDARYNLANVLAKRGRLEEAYENYLVVLRRNPRNADAHSNLGNILLSNGNTDEAIQHFEEALRNRPDHAEAHNNLGNALDTLGRKDEAEYHYREALRSKPEYTDALNNLGVLLAGRRAFSEAEQCYREVLRLDPDYIDVYNNLGVALVSQGRYVDAIRQFQQVLRVNPSHPQALRNLADARRRMGQ